MGQQGGAPSVPYPSLGLAGALRPVSGLAAVANALITRMNSLSLLQTHTLDLHNGMATKGC